MRRAETVDDVPYTLEWDATWEMPEFQVLGADGATVGTIYQTREKGLTRYRGHGRTRPWLASALRDLVRARQAEKGSGDSDGE